MSKYIKTDTLTYPLTELEVRAAFPGTIFSDQFDAPPGYAAVVPTARPVAPNPTMQNVVEDTPVLVGQFWTQQWKVVDASAEEIADRQATAKYVTDAASAKQYAKLNALRNMTPSQVQAWVDANVNNLADAKDALKTLAVAVSILARQL